jgi:formylglycine-generating enzyme required for sulfatase activity
MMLPRFLCLVSLVGVYVSSSYADSEISKSAGFVTEKPASGPSVAVEGGFMVPYSVKIPGTSVTFEMIPVPGGKFKMGSPDIEAGRADDEGPQVEVETSPMWVGKTEVTWDEYRVFMSLYSIMKRLQAVGIRKITDENRVDAVTIPTPLYEPSHTFEFGDDSELPAVTMTQYAAKQYTKWISGMTGHQYRLPTAAEWENAARGGTNTAYSFGDSADDLDAFGCFADNNPGGSEKVASKKPNPFGLFDVHGNVWEWVIDKYTADGYQSLGSGPLSGAKSVLWAKDEYPRCVRGGGWQDTADRCRSAARMGSEDEDWKAEDPNQPLSPWWYTSDPARSVGMRIVRSLKPLSKEEIKPFWEIDSTDIEDSVNYRLEEGRGVLGLPVPELAEQLQEGT